MNHLPVYPKAFIAAAKLTRERKRVFAAMPFEAPHSARLWTIIQHECQIRDANPRRGDSPVNPVPIVADILDEMERAEIIIVDLTGNNPNVFYELGIAHTRCDKVLLLCEQGQSRPSDVGFFRCLLFDLKTPQGRAAFSRDLGTRLDDLLKPDGTPTFIEGLIERTQTVIEDLNVLALLPDEELRNETIWFSGFL
ncbi:MAG: hypothetical protein JNK48_08115, partial [Bryobacterales bacterium]|nr:hypothetical protein [Bryobacterales bacterium]